jgi:diacylglycerol kinase family enzyme
VTYRAGDEDEAYFCSMAGVGMSGSVARRLATTTKALGGRVAGLIATFAVFSRWTNVELRVEVDGQLRSGLMEDVLVANTEYHNGGMRLCPNANPEDGVFDVLLIGDVTKRDLLQTLPKLYRGTHLPHPKAELLRGRTVTVDAASPLPIELDGEQPGTTPVRFEVVPGALRVRVPADA